MQRVACTSSTLVLATLMLALAPAAQAQQGRSDRDQPPSSQSPFSEPRPQRSPRDKGQDKSQEKSGDAKQAAEPKPIPSRLRRPGGSGVPEGGAERAKLLAELYAHLASAPDEAAANRVATAIEHVWRSHGSDTVGLLIERAQRASNEKKHELAIRLLDRAAQLAPDVADVFKARAAANYAQDEYRAAVGDLRRVLALEPNDFKALEMLASIFKDLGRKRAALEVYRKLYDVHPQMSGLKMVLDEIEREVVGQAG